jgi:hypothetical protein
VTERVATRSPVTDVPLTTTARPPTTSLLPWTPLLLDVEYRSDLVDVGHPRFEFQSTAGSSVVTGAWYDGEAGYLVIGLNNTYYHYCRVPADVWAGFSATASYGRYFNEVLKGDYDCRGGDLPEYAE